MASHRVYVEMHVRLLLRCLLLHSCDTLSLLSNAGSTTFPGGLVFDAAGFHLVGKDFGAALLGLGLVDVLHENTLVLENVTLRFLVKDVVEMLIDLSSLPILSEQPPQHPLSPHPQNFARHPGLRGTLSLTRTGVTTLSLGGEELACASAGVDGGGFDDDTAVLDELLDVCAGVGVSNLGLLSGVEPDFAFADAGDARGETLL